MMLELITIKFEKFSKEIRKEGSDEFPTKNQNERHTRFNYVENSGLPRSALCIESRQNEVHFFRHKGP